MITDITIALVGFLVFIFLQALFINGLNECFKGGVVNDMNKGKIYSGMIFYMMAPEFFQNNKHKAWAKPVYACVRCMSSVWGSITFFSAFVPVFGFHLWEIPVLIADVFILVYVTFFLYQKG